jgi:hypothetical protein
VRLDHLLSRVAAAITAVSAASSSRDDVAFGFPVAAGSALWNLYVDR